MKDIKKEIQEELEQLAPSLSKLKKEKGYEIPQDYFNKLPDQILKQLDFPSNSTEVEAASWKDLLLEKIAVFFQPKLAMGFAMATLFLFSIYFLSKNTTPTTTPFAQVSLDEIENYVNDNIDDFDDEILFEFVAELEENSFDNLDIQEEDLEEYMDEIIEDLDDSELGELL